MIKVFKYLKPNEWLMALFSLGFIILQVWLDLRMPDYMAEITTLVQTPNSLMRDIWIAGGMMLLCTFGSLCAAVIVGYFWHPRDNIAGMIADSVTVSRSRGRRKSSVITVVLNLSV